MFKHIKQFLLEDARAGVADEEMGLRALKIAALVVILSVIVVIAGKVFKNMPNKLHDETQKSVKRQNDSIINEPSCFMNSIMISGCTYDIG